MKYLKYWAPPALWAVVIFVLSSLEFPKGPPTVLNFVLKKTAHVVEYAILFILLYRAFNSAGWEKKRTAIYSFLLTMAYAASDEYHQTFTSTRTGTVRDLGFDAAGAAGAWGLIWKLLPKAPRKLKNWASRLQVS